MGRGRLMESTYAAHGMDTAFRVTRSPLPPERPPLSRHDADFVYDSDGAEDNFYDSQDMPNYDDPAFSIDPRDNPHLNSRTDLSRMRTSPIPPLYPEFEGADNERLAYRSHDPSQRKSRTRSKSPFIPQPPPTTSSASDSYSSSSNEHSPFPSSSATSYQTSVNNSRNVSPATSAEKVDHTQIKPQKSIRNSPRGDLDKVDQLDVSDPFGFMRHHDGPYQTVNDALTKRAPLTKTPSEQRKPKATPQPQTHITTSTSYTGGVLNLVPGQLMPKMPYQPEPPPDWVSPPPTVGRLPTVSPYPGQQFSYDPADLVPQMAPHPSEYIPPQRYQAPMQPLTFPSLASLSPNPNTVLSITNPDPGSPLPTPQPPAPNPHQHYPPSTRRSRLSLPVQPRLHEFSQENPLQKPSSDVSRTPPMPATSSPARSAKEKLTTQASALNMHSRSYDPRQNAYIYEQEVKPPEVHMPYHNPALQHNQQIFDSPRDSHLTPPDIRLPSAPSVMSGSTNSSKKSGKSLPRHVPKKLVMPTPLQPLQTLNQSQGLPQGSIGSTNSTYYPPPHPHASPPTLSASVSTSTHTHQQLHLSKSRKSGLTREMQLARASGYYPPPLSHSKSQHRQSPGIQPSLSMRAPSSDRSDQSPRPDREQEREHRRSRRETMMNPGVGNYLEAKAGSSGFKSSIGSRSTRTSTSGMSGSRSERHRGRSHHRASSDGYRTGYESSSNGGKYLDTNGYSDPNLLANGQLYPYHPGTYTAEHDPRAVYDPHQASGYDIPPRDHDRDREHRERRERRDRDRERGRTHRHTKSHPDIVLPSQPHSHSLQPLSQLHLAQEIPIIRDDKQGRHTLKKRATVNGQAMSWTISVNDAGLAAAPPMKEKQKSKNKPQSHLGHGGVEGIGPYLDVPGLKDREKSSQSSRAKKSSGFGLGSLLRSLSSKGKEEDGEADKERMYREWAASGAGTAISNSSSKSGRKLSKVRSRH